MSNFPAEIVDDPHRVAASMATGERQIYSGRLGERERRTYVR
jgi:hypothetical protein